MTHSFYGLVVLAILSKKGLNTHFTTFRECGHLNKMAWSLMNTIVNRLTSVNLFTHVVEVACKCITVRWICGGVF